MSKDEDRIIVEPSSGQIREMNDEVLDLLDSIDEKLELIMLLMAKYMQGAVDKDEGDNDLYNKAADLIREIISNRKIS